MRRMPNLGTRNKPPKEPHRLFVTPVLDEIIAAVEDGVWGETAARAQGVAHAIWFEWLRWGRSGFEPYTEFVDRFETAEAAVNVFHVRNVKRCAKGDNVVVLHDAAGNEIGVRTVGDWKASQFWLTRKYPREWSEREALRQAAEDAISKDEMQLPLELLEKYLEKAGYRLVPLVKEDTNDAEGKTGGGD